MTQRPDSASRFPELGFYGLPGHTRTPKEFAPVLREYERIRPAHLFEGRTNRPGGHSR
jgi:hypothetical protein